MHDRSVSNPTDYSSALLLTKVVLVLIVGSTSAFRAP